MKKNIGKKIKPFTWVSSIKISENNAFRIMKAARARWKIENETFQTLKSETSYNLNHSYGHGKKHFCTIFGILTMLVFFVDQVQEMICPSFKKALRGAGTKRDLWESFRSTLNFFLLDSWEALFKIVIAGYTDIPEAVGCDSS